MKIEIKLKLVDSYAGVRTSMTLFVIFFTLSKPLAAFCAISLTVFVKPLLMPSEIDEPLKQKGN